MKFEKTECWGFEHAIRGMRQPLQSHSKSDSFNCFQGDGNCEKCPYFIDNHSLSESICLKESEIEEVGDKPFFVIGKNDLELAQKLIKAGSEHRKFLRQIFVATDITAPLYWWKEADQYKVGTTTNSTSTMHKLASTPITIDCFEMDDFVNFEVETDDLNFPFISTWNTLIIDLNFLRLKYNETKDKKYWKELIRLLPESWLQTRTVTMNYENLLNMYHQRKNHKLSEWHKFCEWVESLPYAKELIIGE